LPARKEQIVSAETIPLQNSKYILLIFNFFTRGFARQLVTSFDLFVCIDKLYLLVCYPS